MAFDRGLILREDELLLYPKGYLTRPSFAFMIRCPNHRFRNAHTVLVTYHLHERLI
jgi:hypothetical protein